MNKIIPNLFGIVPVLSAITISVYLFATPNKPLKKEAQAAPIISEQVEYQGESPTRIEFSELGLKYDVKNAQVSNNNWDLYEDAASYLVTSGKIGVTGNAVFYAHNKTHLFGSLSRISVNDHIIVSTNESEKLYVVKEKKVVSPADLSIVYPLGDQRITLFTCTNFLDADRLVIVATPAATFSDIL